MASTQEAEIIFAQKLASNEKPVRSRALVKLRKYISARSERAGGGFTEDELLKIWKGLFYCVWMQDRPLLQEELSSKISALLHSFQTVDSQFLYFKTFLQTMKREWNGIDRLRMDKFYQLVRFVFRQMFELLKRQDWQSSLVNEFLQLISVQLLQSSSSSPSGLLLHVLDLYLSELALIGSAQLTAGQNQTFIEPFCKTMAKTKDRVLLKAIGSNIFDTIVDQVPFAIEDLLREIHQDGGQDSDSSDGSDIKLDSKGKMKTGHLSKTSQKISAEEDDDDEEDSLEPDQPLFEEDNTCGPVLQFDYVAIADRLFELASHSNIPSFNRSKIYKFVKIFRDLSEGVFPQDEVEVVSSDEDDDYDDNRRRRKRRKRMNKGQKEEQSQEKKAKALEGSETTAESGTSQNCKQEKKKKRKKSSESVEDQQTETNTAQVSKPQTTHKIKKMKEKPASENHSTNSSIDPTEDVLDPKPAKKGKKKPVSRTEEVADPSETDLSVAPALQKKKRKLKTKTKDIDGGEKAADCANTEHIKQAENCCADTQSATVTAHISSNEEPSTNTSTVTPSLKKRKARNPCTEDRSEAEQTENNVSVPAPNTKKKSKKTRPVALDGPEAEGHGESHAAEILHTDEQLADVRKKKRKQKSGAAVEVNGDSEHTGRKRNLMNGHTEKSVKRPKVNRESKTASLPADTENKMKTEGFVFCQKKTPSPIFCKAAGFHTPVSRKKSLPTSKSETKKVTFGLKNNKTMEFRKMDQSSLVSPAGESRVAFDPKKTPKSGVLKSPSPALKRRLTAADFF